MSGAETVELPCVTSREQAERLARHNDPLLRPYQSPYGKLPGLAGRLRKFEKGLRTNRSYPWLGTGIIADLELIMQLLSLPEFVDWLRTKGPEEHRRFADEIEEIQGEVETVDDAAAHVSGLPEEPYSKPGVETIEALDRRAVQFVAIRNLLKRLGVADDKTRDDELVPLLTALLA